MALATDTFMHINTPDVCTTRRDLGNAETGRFSFRYIISFDCHVLFEVSGHGLYSVTEAVRASERADAVIISFPSFIPL